MPMTKQEKDTFMELYQQVQTMSGELEELKARPAAPVSQGRVGRPTPRQLYRLFTLTEFVGTKLEGPTEPSVNDALAAGYTFEHASARLTEWKNLFANVPKGKVCVYCAEGSHPTVAEVRACWESTRQNA